MNRYEDWIGRQEQASDIIEPTRTRALCATLAAPRPLVPGDPLPLLHHWMYFWDVRQPSALGEDGHPTRGGFLPPIPLPRRMWAGGRLRFLQPLEVGDQVRRTSTILKVEEKSGRSGDLVFVTVEHELRGHDGIAIVEEQDLVYRGPAIAGSIALPYVEEGPAPASLLRSVVADPILLFRYSALTMNGHRIHYDRPYAMNEEAYPGLVVHGPLQATLLIEAAAERLTRPITSFEFRGQQPAFDGRPLHVCGELSEAGGTMWTEQGGVRNMVAAVGCD